MPHVVLSGPVDLEAMWKAFATVNERAPTGEVFKLQEAWLNHHRTGLLLDCIVVDRGITRRFLTAVNTRPDRTTVHLDQLTLPPTSDGVLRLLLRVVAEVRKSAPALTVTSHDLPEHLAQGVGSRQ